MARVGILYPGALGAALGNAVSRAGDAAMTCVAGRSVSTRHRAIAANFVLLDTLEEVIRKTDIVISLVPPVSAADVAMKFSTSLAARPGHEMPPIFVEANSVSPAKKKAIEGRLSAVHAPCVDGAFLGPANQIGNENVMLLSGPSARDIASIFEKVVEVRVVGIQVGEASSLKMMMTMITKTLPALFIELVCASANTGQLTGAIDLMKRLYPGIISFIERTLPTYPAHMKRRLSELKNVQDWLLEQRQSAVMTSGAIVLFERLLAAGIDPERDWKFDDLIGAIGSIDLQYDCSASLRQSIGTDSQSIPGSKASKVQRSP